MEKLTLIDVVEATQGTLENFDHGQAEVSGISTDTRTLAPGDLFVPLKGEKFDGHDYIPQAIDQGAAAYLTEQDSISRNGRPTPGIKVDSTLGAFMQLARYYRNRFDLKVVGITGSNGKTTTKELLGRLLQQAGATVYSQKSFNNFVGLPLTLFHVDRDTRYLVLEMGTNSPGEISALTRVASPEIGVITNIHDCHLDGLKNREGVMREKSALIEGLQGAALAVLNRDDPAFDSLANAARGRVVAFSLCHRTEYTGIDPKVDCQGVAFTVKGRRYSLPLLGVHNIYNALAAFACASELGLSADRIEEVFTSFEGPPMRLKLIRNGSLRLINDAYNANPGSMESAIKTFSLLPAQARKIVVLGDMLELGSDSPALHKKVGEQLTCGKFDLIIAVGVRAREYLAGALEHGVSREKLLSFTHLEEAVLDAPAVFRKDDFILIKGSRRTGLERLVDALLAMEF